MNIECSVTAILLQITVVLVWKVIIIECNVHLIDCTRIISIDMTKFILCLNAKLYCNHKNHALYMGIQIKFSEIEYSNLHFSKYCLNPVLARSQKFLYIN